MTEKHSPAFRDYSAAFKDADQPFLFSYRYENDHRIRLRTFTRGEFLILARKAAGALRANGQERGCRILHCFGGNDCHDLPFRLAISCSAHQVFNG
jgi:hypothetical protein